jgi:hypothetical protein
LGYEFFEIDPDTKRVHELDEAFGAKAQIGFWMKLDDLAQDICALLVDLEHTVSAKATTGEKKCAIFLAESTVDLREQRDAIRRDLQQHGHTVLPAGGVPMVFSEITTSFQADLARCDMSIHPVGKNYGFIPEGSTESLIEIQNELAIERGKQGNFSRLVWIPPGLEVQDERQQKFLERLRTDSRAQAGADLLEVLLEDLRTVIHDRLTKPPEQAKEGSASACQNCPQVYLIYDQRDADSSAPCADALFNFGLDVVHPTFEGDEADVRECHEENLRECDGALILYGKVNELWVARASEERWLRSYKASKGSCDFDDGS